MVHGAARRTQRARLLAEGGGDDRHRTPERAPFDGIQEAVQRLEEGISRVRDAAADHHQLGIDHVEDRRDAAGQAMNGA